ncbi:PIG-L family deacetylase [Leisingera sp. MMG026]|uniref:PIG-L deacetylase family protein n=1 Tax=Leisingera sp. MMG026 TaxID=2909982 RepID=UPI001F1D03F4|nr:PIG-L family deacetylase [Leisingera sp. MMG026]MCF6430600.1 PIG-L family deacetylase [Leisingera sp. MMG026]
MTELAPSATRPAAPPPLRQRAWLQAEQTACRGFHAALRLKARDMTARTAHRTALVLAPHADDETLGCGGLIALKRRSGTPVTVLMATDGSASHRYEQTLQTTGERLAALREAETRTACARLGVEAGALHFLRFQDSRLDAQEQRLSAAVLDTLVRTQPQEVYVCALSDGHPDHQALARAARRAMAAWDGPAAAFYEYPVWSYDFRSWRGQGSNTGGFLRGVALMTRAVLGWQMHTVRITDLRAQKAHALAAHCSQLGQYGPEPHWSGLPDSFLRHFQSRHELFRKLDPRELSE